MFPIDVWNHLLLYLAGSVILLLLIILKLQIDLMGFAQLPAGPPILGTPWLIFLILLWLFCIVMTALILPSYISQHSEKINNVLTGWAAIVPAIVASICLYWVRGKAPLFYGVLEITVGFFSVYLASKVSGVTLLGKIVGLFGGMYIIVRGLDNLDKGMPKDLKPGWNRSLPSDQNNVSALPRK